MACAFFTAAVQAAPLRLTVLLSEEGGAYQAFSQSLQGILPPDRFKLTLQRADEAPASADLYVAVGMKAATKLSSLDAQVLNVLVPKAGYDKLVRSAAQRAGSRSAVFLDQPMERQIALLQSVLPSVRHVGVLYSTLPPELQSVRRLLTEKNIRLYDRVVDAPPLLNEALEGVLDESEVLFVLPDADVYNAGTIRNILLAAYRKKIPLIGISQAYVKAGALCAVYSTPEQVAEQAAAMVKHYAEQGRLPAAQYPVNFEVSVNQQVARSLDLRIKDAEKLRDEIRRIP